VRSSFFNARKAADIFLSRLFPKHWVPLYTLIAHTNEPIAAAKARYERRTRTARWLGMDLWLSFLALGIATVSRCGKVYRWLRRPASKQADNHPDRQPPAKRYREA
jgi:kynurenine 3-monooxygenase